MTETPLMAGERIGSPGYIERFLLPGICSQPAGRVKGVGGRPA